MQIEKRTLNWLPQASAYDAARAAREKRKAINDAFLEQSDAVASAIQSTRDNLTMGLAEVTAKLAASRASAEASAKAAVSKTA